MALYTNKSATASGGASASTITGFTEKRIPFGTAAGALEDVADLTYDKTTHDLLLSVAEAGGVVGVKCANTSNTASSESQVVSQVAGTSAGDPVHRSIIDGTSTWTWGLDNSVAGTFPDPWKLSGSSALGTTDFISAASLGGTEKMVVFGSEKIVGSHGHSYICSDLPATGRAGAVFYTASAASEQLASLFVASNSNAASTVGIGFIPSGGSTNDYLSTSAGAKIVSLYTSSGDFYDFKFSTKVAGTHAVRLAIDGFDGVKANHRLQELKGADIASAGTITAVAGNFFDITGTTAIDYLTTTNWQTGVMISFQFDASVTVNHNTGSVPANTKPFLLAGAANFSATAGDMLTVRLHEDGWREVARTVI